MGLDSFLIFLSHTKEYIMPENNLRDRENQSKAVNEDNNQIREVEVVWINEGIKIALEGNGPEYDKVKEMERLATD